MLTILYNREMFHWLKNHFIPHKGNDHHPHILRTEAIVFLLGLAIFTEVAFLLAVFVVLPQSGFLALITPSVLVNAANATRHDTKESTLATNTLLKRAAQLKANDMATKGYFAHTSPAGITPWHWLDAVGYRYTTAGENLAVDFIDSSDVHQAWMNSPSHRANILNGSYTEIGIATATGTYQGHTTVFVVQFFGAPRTSTSTPSSLPKAVAPSKTTAPPASAFAFTVAQAADAPVIGNVITAPRQSANYMFVFLGGIILLALILTIVVKRELPHPQKAILPMAIIVVVISFILLNHKIALAALHIY